MAIRPTNQRHRICGAAAENLADERHRRPSRSRRRFWITASLGFLMTASTGCGIVGKGVNRAFHDVHECVDDSMVEFRNRALAEKAWIRVRHAYLHRQYHRDFKKGFVSGYMDVAAGSNGCTPALSPPEYWGWKYQSPAGHSAVNAWFEGYPYGAKAAEQDGIGNWQNVTMRMKTPADPNTAEMQHGGIPGAPVPYYEEGEALPAPMMEPHSIELQLEESPSDLPEQEAIEIIDPASAFHQPAFNPAWNGLPNEPSVSPDYEIATRPDNGSTFELFVPDDGPMEFSHPYVNDLFEASDDSAEGSGSEELPFSFE